MHPLLKVVGKGGRTTEYLRSSVSLQRNFPERGHGHSDQFKILSLLQQLGNGQVLKLLYTVISEMINFLTFFSHSSLIFWILYSRNVFPGLRKPLVHTKMLNHLAVKYVDYPKMNIGRSPKVSKKQKVVVYRTMCSKCLYLCVQEKRNCVFTHLYKHRHAYAGTEYLWKNTWGREFYLHLRLFICKYITSNNVQCFLITGKKNKTPS